MRLEKCVKLDTKNARKIEIMGWAKGLGPVAVSTFLAELPELGKRVHPTSAYLIAARPVVTERPFEE